MATPDQIADYVRFQLAQLSAKNGHHEFEHLCRHLARGAICPHILPATGPVSSGGDQGRDFETFRTFLQSAGKHATGFLGTDGNIRIAFICTLERELPLKVKSDLKRIRDSGFPGSLVYCFSPHDLPVAKRNKLKTTAAENFGIDLEIFDGQAISELLAQRKHFWIAARYLSIPSEILPEVSSDAPDWYRKLLKHETEESEALTFANFIELKQAARYATYNEEVRADILIWRARLERYLSADQPASLQRKVRYELSVASIRGLGAADDCVGHIEAFFTAATSSADLVDIDDAVLLLAYCHGGVLAGALHIDEIKLSTWAASLQSEIERRLASTRSENDRCLLLQNRGDLCLRVTHGMDLPAKFDEAVRWWLQFAAHLPKAPLFPLDRFSEVLTACAEHVSDLNAYSKLTEIIDREVSLRHGKAVGANRCYQRALVSAKAGRIRMALRDLHRAKIDWFAHGTLGASVLAMRLIADCYLQLRLPAAAKYYALAATILAATAKDDAVAQLLPASLLKVTEADYAQGAWFSHGALMPLVVSTHTALRHEPGDLDIHGDMAACVQRFATIIACSVGADSRCSKALWEFAEAAGLASYIKGSLARYMNEWNGKSDDALRKSLQEDLTSGAFGDTGHTRTIKWAALGVTWSLQFSNTREASCAAEGLASTLQMVLAEFSDYEMYILPTTATIFAELAGTETPEVERLSGTDANHWRVQIPKVTPSRPEGYLASDVFALAVQILGELALLPRADFLKLLDSSFRDGITGKVFVASPFSNLFLSLYTPDIFAEEERRSFCAPDARLDVPPTSSVELSWRSARIEKIRGETLQDRLHSRYTTYTRVLSRTLPRLRREPTFVRVIEELRRRGWLDWHILAAVFSITHNYRRTQTEEIALLTGQQLRQFASAMLNSPEPEDAPEVPLQLLCSYEELEEHRKLNMTAILDAMGLQLAPGMQDMNAIEQFLSVRTGYWNEDSAHEDPFTC
ncbi:hypothetical protein [Corallococcus sp. AB049A]|uniref:hypothetical protein n=1 Tax=Corallococcus sp. AB049A TaxID=2316721 RepID=UPI0011C3EFDF|nr:hypothetical protein [Corallococcus sp. AB049A]